MRSAAAFHEKHPQSMRVTGQITKLFCSANSPGLSRFSEDRALVLAIGIAQSPRHIAPNDVFEQPEFGIGMADYRRRSNA